MKAVKLSAGMLGAWALLALSPSVGGRAEAQTVFDHMKCYKIKDSQDSKQYTADLHPKLTHDFQTEIGDRIIGGTTVKGCRLKVPAKFFCTDVDPQDVHDVKPPYDPSQWTIDGPESGDRLCYKLTCPPVLPKTIDVIDQFGNRTIELRGRTEYFCTPVNRQAVGTDPCDMAANGQCGGTCGAGMRCLATSPSGCDCVPEEQACATSSVCGEGFCGGVWETCVSMAGGICGCAHPP